MKIFDLDLLLNLPAFILSDSAAKFTNSNQDVDILLSNLSLSGYAIPIEGGIIGIFACLLAYLLTEHNRGVLSHEKFKLTINIVQRVQTPLILLRNQLEGIVNSDIPETVSRKAKQALEHTEQIIDCSQNAIALDNADWKNIPQTPAMEFEFHTYIISVVNQCRPYASSRRIQLKVHEDSGYIACNMNEIVMTAALQHLLNRMIDITAPGSCINITTSYTANTWQLHISNYMETKNQTKKRLLSIPIVFLIYGYIGLWTVRKIIRLHRGTITGYVHGNMITFQLAVPADCHCKYKEAAEPEYPTADKEKTIQTDTHLCVLLVMADKQFSNYLKAALSEDFLTSILESPDLAINTTIRQHPDAIIIDETINGVYGDEVCSRIKADETISNIPVVLLVKAGDNKSYLSHMGSRADRLELRTDNICRLKTDIHMLINSHIMQRRQAEQFLANAIAATIPTTVTKDNDSLEFMKKVHELLEENLDTAKYTIDILCADIGMCRTNFYKKIKMITGRFPKEYICSFKMGKARELLASQLYNVTEVACMLGFCDAKYFGKKFKDFYHVCPTDYIKSITE